MRGSFLLPSVGIAHGEHGSQNVIPGFRTLHGFVREHAAIPADVLHGPGYLTVVVAQPESGITHDIETAIGVMRQAVVAGLIMRTGAFDRAVILGDVEINGPGPQG